MMRIVLLGAPGSGKGTQAQRLQAKYGVPQVSSGDLLRDATARRTELGLKAKAVMDAGQLVSDDIVLELIRDRLKRADAANGFILDGFPRNVGQADALDTLLREFGQPLDAVLLLEVGRNTLVRRLAGRRICPKCGTVYNVHSMPGVTACPKDGAELHQRLDDKEDVVGKRLEVYERQTRPLVDYYAKQGLLRVVMGEGELDEVSERMESAALTKPVAADKVKVDRRRPVSKRPKKATRAATKSTSRSSGRKPAVKAKRVAARKTVKKTAKKAVNKKAAKKMAKKGAPAKRARKAQRAQTARSGAGKRRRSPARKK